MQSIKSILSFFLISCENFNELTKNRLVLQRIWLTPYFNHLVLLDDKTKKLIFSCYEAKNPRALLIMGTYKYFLNQEVIEGKRLIEEAIAYGDFIATYIHGVILCFPCSSFKTSKRLPMPSGFDSQSRMTPWIYVAMKSPHATASSIGLSLLLD